MNDSSLKVIECRLKVSRLDLQTYLRTMGAGLGLSIESHSTFDVSIHLHDNINPDFLILSRQHAPKALFDRSREDASTWL